MLRYPSQRKLKTLLAFNPKTGIFRWKVRASQTIKIGDATGVSKPGAYAKIQIGGVTYQAHLLAWIYVYGVRPAQLDHKDCEPSNNRLKNLRVASQSNNLANVRKSAGRSSRFKGVTWHKQCARWQAGIKKDGKNHYLGLFDREEDAHAAYVVKARELYGDFARAA